MSTEYDLAELLLEVEWRKCAPDWDTSTVDELLEGFVHFCSHYWFIRHPSRGRIKFEMRDAQIETARHWLTDRYSLVLKARQIGFSTLAAALAFWLTFFYDDRQIIMLSKAEREAVKLLNKSKYGFRFLPEWMKVRGPLLNTNTQTKMDFTNESAIESLPSASDPARGEAVFLVIVDEWAFLPNPDEAWASIEPVADVGGRVIGLSTANGEGNFFHTEWVKAETGVSRFVPLFFPWSAGGRDQAWYDDKARDLPDWQMAQEYPSNPDEAFLKSGRPVFNTEKLRSLEVVEPARGYLRDLSGEYDAIEFIEDGGELRIWTHPVPGRRYSMGADVAEGLEHGDFSVSHVIDSKTGEVVAKWHGHIDPDLFGADVLNLLGRYYNDALAIVENNNHGLVTLKALQRVDYPSIYRTRRLAQRHSKPTEQLGWKTTVTSKPLAIDDLWKAIRDDAIELKCKETIAELRTFRRQPDGKMEGSPFDDRTMSLAIAVQGLQHVHKPEFQPPPPKPGPGTMAWFLAQKLDQSDEPKRKPIGFSGVRAA